MKVRDNVALNCSFIKTTVGDFVCEVTSEFIPRARGNESNRLDESA